MPLPPKNPRRCTRPFSCWKVKEFLGEKVWKQATLTVVSALLRAGLFFLSKFDFFGEGFVATRRHEQLPDCL